MPRTQPFFLPVSQAHRFSVLFEPPAAAVRRGGILFVQPFAEEMNNARRVVATQARAFADAGWTVLLIDLFGCGDSPGDFGEATWERWILDVVEAAQWLRARIGRAPILWGLRAGCLVADEAARRMGDEPKFLFWQPVLSGKQFLQQFLRLKVAQQLIAPPDGPLSSTRALREQLERGETVEVAGYGLSTHLALGLERAQLEGPVRPTRAAWLEIGRGESFPPAARAQVQSWERSGHRVDAAVVRGAAFWQIPGVTEVPALVSATLAATGGLAQ